jgi:hypothetical protein
MNLPNAWSFSSAKLFDTCPRKYQALKVTKEFKEPDNTEQLLYGKEYHTAAELYVRDGTPLPDKFRFTKPHLDAIIQMPGDKYCEYKMGLTETLEPCDFFDSQVWFRGVADLLIINEEIGSAKILDYKTGRSAKYADTGQLELMALAVFKHFPKVVKVKAGLLFVVANEFKKAEYRVDQSHVYWRNWMPLIARLEAAHHSGVWNPKQSGLCKRHCVVTTCPHNGANK